MDTILIVAGEVSGDMHGAGLVRELKKKNSQVRFFGIGGNRLQSEGVELLYHSNDLAFLGFVEVVKHLPFIRRVKNDIISEVQKRGVSHAILIDYPGFNLNLAQTLSRMGVAVIYYISPQLWAWGRGRVKKIRDSVKKMLVVFPFEEEMYKSNNIDAVFVGHPLIEQLQEYSFVTKEKLYNELSIDPSKEILLLLPGSRKQEVEEIFVPALEGANRIAKKFNLEVVVVCAENINPQIFSDLSGRNDFIIARNRTYELMKYSSAGIIKSGTSTLQAALMGLPMVVVYKTSALTYHIGKFLIKIKNIALANIVAQETIVPELIQDDVTPENIESLCSRYFTDMDYTSEVRRKLLAIREKLGSLRAAERAAEIISGELKWC